MLRGFSMQLDRKGADFRRLRHPDLASQRIGEQLMPEADTDERLSPSGNPFANGLLLLPEPGMLLFLPGIHGAAEHEHEIMAIKRGNRLARERLDGGDGPV